MTVKKTFVRGFARGYARGQQSSNLLLKILGVAVFAIFAVLFIAFGIALAAAPWVLVVLIAHWLGAF